MVWVFEPSEMLTVKSPSLLLLAGVTTSAFPAETLLLVDTWTGYESVSSLHPRLSTDTWADAGAENPKRTANKTTDKNFADMEVVAVFIADVYC
jgi:hypothetical protein